MSAYLVTSGDYSDYHVHYVATSRDVAEGVAARLNAASERMYSEFDVEEVPLALNVDDVAFSSRYWVCIEEADRPWSLNRRSRPAEWTNEGSCGSEHHHRLQTPTPHVEATVFRPGEPHPWHDQFDWRIDVYVTNAPSQEAAWKIAREHQARLKAEVMGL